MTEDKIVAAITEMRVGIMARFDRVEDRLSQISDDITVNMGRADRAHTSVENTRDELRALGHEVAAVTRRQPSRSTSP
jgi:hypothetical protein